MAQLKKYGSAVDVRQPDISVAHQSGVDDLSVVVTDSDFLDDSHIDDDPGSASTRFPFGSTGVVVQKQNVKRFYTKTLDLFEKVQQFNEFLKKDIVVKNFTSKSCDSVCLSTTTFRLQRCVKLLPWTKVLGNVSLLGTKEWLSQQGGSYSAISMDVMKKHNISSEGLPAPYYVYDPVSSGPGVLTYILSSLETENSSFIQLKTRPTSFYDCTMSTTMKRRGGFWKISGAMTPSTCHAPCSDDLNTLSTPIALPDYALHVDYTMSAIFTECHEHQKLPFPHADEVSRRILHNRATADILTSMDVVTAGGYVSFQTLTTTNQAIDQFQCYNVPEFEFVRPINGKVLTTACEDEVFMISGYSANNYYHFIIEQMARVSAFVPFLQSNPQIKLRINPAGAFYVERYMKVFGLKNALITSPDTVIIRAKVVYLPHAGGCHNSNFAYMNLVSEYFHRFVEKNAAASELKPVEEMTNSTIADANALNKRIILLIKR